MDHCLKGLFIETIKNLIDKFSKENKKDKLYGPISAYNCFEQMFLEILNIYAPIKKKVIVKSKISENLKLYKKQKIFYSKLYKKERRKYHNKLGLRNVTGNRKFWKTMKPFLSGKVTTFLKIYLTQNEDIISEESKVDNLFSNLFENAFNLSDIKKRRAMQ